MSESDRYLFNHKEITELLIKHKDIHEGYWSIAIEFALSAANVSTGPNDPDRCPSAIVPVRLIGIRRVDNPDQLSVDASVINPLKKIRKKKDSSVTD